MKREVPLLITFLCGIFFIINSFIVHPGWKTLADKLNIWALIIISFAYVLGVTNVGRIHYRKTADRKKGWGYSVLTLIGMGIMILFGIFIPETWRGGYEEGSLFLWIFDNAYVPMQATMFSLLAFYIASAAFRAFRIKTVLASLLAVTAVIVMLGRVSIGEYFWNDLPDFVEWIMACLQNAGKRAIMIGAALGAISTGLKIILGIERSYISGE